MLGTQMINPARGPVVSYPTGVGGVVAYRVVMLYNDEIRPANGENATHAGYVTGMALQTALEGVQCKVQTSGEITNPAWSLTPGAIYFVALGGTISATPPVVGFVQKIGLAKNATTLVISLGEAIKVI
jgi:hypothetical protein